MHRKKYKPNAISSKDWRIFFTYLVLTFTHLTTRFRRQEISVVQKTKTKLRLPIVLVLSCHGNL